MSPRHRRMPPYPVGPAIREQGAGFWLWFAAAGVVAVVFVAFFMTRAYLGLDRIEQHAEDVHRHEQFIER